MQWVGAVMAFLVIVVRGSIRYRDNHMTISEARAKLDYLEIGR